MREFRTAYGPKLKVAIEFPDRSRTRQSMLDETNINFIMQRYTKTGLVSHVNRFQGDYSDLGHLDFHEAMNQLIEAREVFAEIPAGLRKKFDNDPGRFLEFVTDPANLDEMRELGLALPLAEAPVEAAQAGDSPAGESSE